MDHLINAARSGRYWMLCPETDGTWTLRQLDDRTGETSEPYATSPVIGASDLAAVAWAREIPDVAQIDGWHGPDAVDPEDGPWIEEAYGVVRELRYGRRPGRDLVVQVQPDAAYPDQDQVIIRELWLASGRESRPLYVTDRSTYDDDADMLARIGAAYALDPTGWSTVKPGTHVPTQLATLAKINHRAANPAGSAARSVSAGGPSQPTMRTPATHTAERS